MTELLNIKASEFSLTVEKVEELKKPFTPLANQYKEYIPDIEKVLAEKTIDESLVKKAKRLKLDIAGIRTATWKVKTVEKAWVLQVWNAIQKCHNIIVDVIVEQEEKLNKIVKHFENIEIERKKMLRIERINLLKDYEVENLEELNLWDMEESVFDSFKTWCIKSFEDKKALEKKQEEDKKAKEEADKLEQEKIRKENEKLKAEADIREKELEKERKAKEKLEKANEVLVEKEVKKVFTPSETTVKVEKVDKYKEWLKENEWNYDKIIKEEWRVILYKKVSEFII